MSDLTFGRSEDELHAAFDKVCDPVNWKMPIDTTVPADADQNLISDAIIYFTGSVPDIYPEDDHLRVEAAGYYNSVGS